MYIIVNLKKLYILTSKQHLKQGLDCIAHGEAFVVDTIVGDAVDAVDVGVGAAVGSLVGTPVGEEVGIDVEDGAAV